MKIWCYTYDAPVTSHFSAKNWVLHKPSHSWYDIQTLSAQKGFRVSSPDLLLLYSKKLIVWHDKVVTNNTFIFTSPHRAASSSGLNVDITSKIVSEFIYLLYQVTFGGVKDNVSTTLLGNIQLPIHHIQSNNTFGIFLPIDKTKILLQIVQNVHFTLLLQPYPIPVVHNQRWPQHHSSQYFLHMIRL